MRTIIVLGAGASASDGAPVQAQLLRAYFQSTAARQTNDVQLAKFFQSFYGIDVREPLDSAVFPTFEEALGTLELALSRNETFRAFNSTDDPHALETVREALIFSIGVILRETLDRWHDGNPGNNHFRLAQTLIARRHETAVMSFNYDLLIDNALLRCGLRPDYGTDLSNWPRGGPVSLFKLHGSLNWLRCPICTSITCTGTDKGAPTQ
jgi:hypothetical protein